MTRYADPDAGVITRKTVAIVTAGDYFPFVVGGSIIGFISGGFALGTIIDAGQPLGALLFLPILLMIVMGIVTAGKSVGSTSSRGDETLTSAYALFDQIRGEQTETLARPLMRKIYAHAKGDGHGYFGDCRSGACTERVAMLRKLVPAHKSANNKSDIDAAKQYIKMIEDAEVNHRKMLKELGEA